MSNEGGSTAVYVAIDAVQFDTAPKIRRYTLQGSSGCTLGRDNAFGTSGELAKELGPTLEADSTGALWTLSDPTIARVHPTPLSCTLSGGLSGKFANRFALDPTAANGYVQFEGSPHLLGKLTAGASCAIAQVTLSGAPAGYRMSVADLAIDSSGRLHVAWSTGGPDGVEIYDGTGAYVKSYVPDATHPSVAQVAACGTGMCTLGSDATSRSFSRCNADGASCVSQAVPYAKADTLYLAASPGARSFLLHVAGTKVDIVAGP